MRKQKQNGIWQRLLLILMLIACGGWGSSSVAVAATKLAITAASDAQVRQLQEDIELKQLEIDKLQKKIAVYEQSLEAKRQERITLSNQLEIISEQMQALEMQAQEVQLQIDTTNLEIQSIVLQILDTEDQMNRLRLQLAEFLRTIRVQDQRTALDVLMGHRTFSDFFDQVQQLEDVEKELARSLQELKGLQQQLNDQQAQREQKSQQLQEQKSVLEEKKAKLDEQESAKTYYLAQTKRSEKQFQSLVAQAKSEQQAINNEIVSLEKAIRKKLDSSGEGAIVSTGRLMWPVPKNTITAYFHDPDYPFRNVFEHPAIDIRASQGTPIKAADSGYVAKAKNNGRGYSYIMLVHADGLSTVYGHVSKIYVKADSYVKQGEVIGLSGGMPGTSGAGPLTTGAHLHLEVRLNGIPVDPLGYLP